MQGLSEKWGYLVLGVVCLALLACTWSQLESFGRVASGAWDMGKRIQTEILPSLQPQLDLMATEMADALGEGFLDGDGLQVSNSDAIVSMLGNAGRSIELGNTIEAPLFSVAGRWLVLESGTAQMYEFPSEEIAQSEADLVSPDGRWIGEVRLDWGGPVHFYRSGSVILIYFGDDLEMLGSLQSLLGPPFRQG